MTPPDAAALNSYFEKLWTDHLDMIRSILAPLVGDDHWEDAAQRLAIRLLSRLPILLAQEQDALSRGEPSPHHWPNYIARAAKNVATNMHRDASRRLQADSLDRLSSHSLPPVPC